MAKGERKSSPTRGGHGPGDDEGLSALVGEGQQDDAGGQQGADQRREAMGRPGAGGAARQGTRG
jgi:hypothetical protein